MRVLFLEIDTERTWSVASLGPAFLAEAIRRAGHEALFQRIPPTASSAEVVELVRDAAPQLLGVSLTTRQWLRVRQLLRDLRHQVRVPVVVGGLHPTFSPEEVLSQTGIDYVCLGEGEGTMLELVNALASNAPVTDIAGLWVAGQPRPPLRPPIEPIDSLPWMARDFLDERHGVVHMTTQRGCPFPCTYCAARMYDVLYRDTGSYGRRRSHADVLAELHAVRQHHDLNYVIFLDDTFTLHHPWVKEFCQQYGSALRVPFSLHARVETVSVPLLQALAEAGCRHITYGVESGSARLRREVMKRWMSNDRIRQVFQWTKDAGIMVTANYMLGIPGETVAEMEETLALHQELDPEDFGFFVFYPYPGTDLFEVCRREGYLPADYLEREANHRESILDLPDASKTDIAGFYQRWTQTRAAHVLRRYGPAFVDTHGAAMVDNIETCAAAG